MPGDSNSRGDASAAALIERWRQRAAVSAGRSPDPVYRVLGATLDAMATVLARRDREAPLALHRLTGELATARVFDPRAESELRATLYGVVECAQALLAEVAADWCRPAQAPPPAAAAAAAGQPTQVKEEPLDETVSTVARPLSHAAVESAAAATDFEARPAAAFASLSFTDLYQTPAFAGLREVKSDLNDFLLSTYMPPAALFCTSTVSKPLQRSSQPQKPKVQPPAADSSHNSSAAAAATSFPSLLPPAGAGSSIPSPSSLAMITPAWPPPSDLPLLQQQLQQYLLQNPPPPPSPSMPSLVAERRQFSATTVVADISPSQQSLGSLLPLAPHQQQQLQLLQLQWQQMLQQLRQPVTDNYGFVQQPQTQPQQQQQQRPLRAIVAKRSASTISAGGGDESAASAAGAAPAAAADGAKKKRRVRRTTARPVHCPMCGERIKTPYMLTVHLRTAHATTLFREGFTFHCVTCDERTAVPGPLRNHEDNCANPSYLVERRLPIIATRSITSATALLAIAAADGKEEEGCEAEQSA